MAQNSIKNKARTLRVSFLDGIFASCMGGLVTDYFTPFLLAIGGALSQVGILSAAPNLFASVVQLKSPDLVKKLGSRKLLINLFVPLQAASLLFMAVIAALGMASPLAFIAAVVMFASFGALVNPPWSSMMSEIIEEKKWGEYFGWRNQALGFVTIAAALSAGFVLRIAKGPAISAGFACLFGAAFIARMFSWNFLMRMEEPALRQERSGPSFFQCLRGGGHCSNFARFVVFVGALNFATNISGPFFSVLMLKGLHFGYPTYIALTAASSVATYLSVKRWGRRSDKAGNVKIMKLTSKLIVFVPALWLINRNPFYLGFAQAFSGFVWAGFNLAASNFVYDSAEPGERTRWVAHLNAATGVCLCLGALAGGLLVTELPRLSGHRILSLFLLSSLLRFVVVFFIPFGLKEVRRVEEISPLGLLTSVAGIYRPQAGD
ncbi:MAG: hypothetical protein M0018_03785 [Nitrospiraceae bacterium]|nr:hypothetical protein [Nitrospiraceae bacterium]